jgi:hypothetical protein
MRRTLRGFLGGLILVSLAASGQAQYGPEGRYRPEAVAAIIDRVHEDLNRGYAVWHLRHGDRERLTHTERQLRDFANHWEHGKFDRGNLDAAIRDIGKVVDENRLSGRERDALWNDVGELRRMREAYERHEIGSN